MLPSCLMLGALCLKHVSACKEPRLFREHAELDGEESVRTAPVNMTGSTSGGDCWLGRSCLPIAMETVLVGGHASQGTWAGSVALSFFRLGHRKSQF